MKKTVFALLMATMFIMGMTSAASAHSSGFAGGMAGSPGAGGGPGMLVVAEDGSLLITEMGAGAMMMSSDEWPEVARELVNLSPSGTERWRASFDDGFPMMPVTAGNLVVFALREDWWIGTGPSGDSGWNHGGGPGSGPGGGDQSDAHADSVVIVALDLTSGQELWRQEIEGDMTTMPQIAPDASRIYVTVRDLDEGGSFGDGPMRQGRSTGVHMLMSTTVVALDPSDGSVLWSFNLSDDQ